MGIKLIVGAQERWSTGLTGNEYKLMMILCEQANERTCEVWPQLEKEQDSIVWRRMGGKRSTIYEALNGLIKKGAIGRVKRGQKNQNSVLRVLVQPAEAQGPENPDAETSPIPAQGPENPDAEEPSGSGFSGLRVRKTRTPSPQSPNPSPPAPRADVAVSVPQQREGEGEIDEEMTITVARVREIRRDWSSKKIREVLRSPEVLERGGPEVARTALLIVAADSNSRYPTRVLQDGPWWAEAIKIHDGVASSPIPEQCLDPRHDPEDPHSKRMLEDPETGRLWPCPKCHPKFFLKDGEAR